MPPKACLYSITSFIYGWQKIFRNKNIFSKYYLYVLFMSFFCKMYNEEKLFTAVCPLKKSKKSSIARSLPAENQLPQNVGQLSTTCSNVLKQPNGELLVAVNHNQLWTMASETVDPIDWSHHPPSWTVPPQRLEHRINQCNLSGTRTCNCSLRGNHLVYVATQGMSQ